jgi:hypothetical protein
MGEVLLRLEFQLGTLSDVCLGSYVVDLQVERRQEITTSSDAGTATQGPTAAAVTEGNFPCRILQMVTSA